MKKKKIKILYYQLYAPLLFQSWQIERTALVDLFRNAPREESANFESVASGSEVDFAFPFTRWRCRNKSNF